MRTAYRGKAHAMKFTKGKKSAEPVARPVQMSAGKPPKPDSNPWIDRRHFEVVLARCVQAENMCKDLIRVIAVDDGEFLASHDFDYLAAGQAILKGEI
jgi:hypothetical protein